MRTWTVLVWLAVAAAGCGGNTAEEAAAPAAAVEPRPNFVVLFADDLGYGDLGSYGHPYNRTPHLDALAAAGQRWTDFYVASPVCSPSRGALLTGRLPVRTGLYGERIGVYFPNDPGGFPDRETTLAETLSAQGYRTGIFGKWHLGDANAAWPTRHGFDEWLGLPYSNDMDDVGQPDFDDLMAMSLSEDNDGMAAAMSVRAERYAAPKLEYWNVPLYASNRTDDGFADETIERPADQRTLTRRYTEAAIEFMQASGDAPFFVYLPYTMPHTPLFRSDAFTERSLGGRYGDVIEELDWSVGEIVKALTELGKLDNTLVLFTSDNGPWLTMRTEGGRAGLLRHGKGTTFEGGVRVPAIFSWPGRLAPGVVSELGSTLDLYVTLTRLAGVDSNAGVDGYDLSPVLLQNLESPRREMPYYRNGTLYAYRLGPWKAHFITEGAYRQPPERTERDVPELYHLLDDPSERFNVAAQHPDVLAEIEAAVAAHTAGLTRLPPEFDRRLVALMDSAEGG